MRRIAINSFVRRQTPDSRFGHTTLSDEALVARVEANFDRAKRGAWAGVLLVPVDPECFFSGTVTLEPGMQLRAVFESRRPGEVPRLVVGAVPPVAGVDPTGNVIFDYEAAKQAAVAVDIVLYASEALARDGDNELPPEPGNWEIVSINPRLCEEEEPIHPNTLMANHFGESGGTATDLSDADFVAALRKARAYWKDKVGLC